MERSGRARMERGTGLRRNTNWCTLFVLFYAYSISTFVPSKQSDSCSYDFVIQAGKFDTFLTLESRTGALVPAAEFCATTAEPWLPVAPLPGAAAGAGDGLGFTPYGLGVPTGGDQFP
mmetsp:Transcript_17452/g.32252  ORF Transcript_17452/g.32252 Transcript_17452/m.32252 type:complete len:118 (-) Transcript_17452:1080-1433(-)